MVSVAPVILEAMLIALAFAATKVYNGVSVLRQRAVWISMVYIATRDHAEALDIC